MQKKWILKVYIIIIRTEKSRKRHKLPRVEKGEVYQLSLANNLTKPPCNSSPTSNVLTQSVQLCLNYPQPLGFHQYPSSHAATNLSTHPYPTYSSPRPSIADLLDPPIYIPSTPRLPPNSKIKPRYTSCITSQTSVSN